MFNGNDIYKKLFCFREIIIVHTKHLWIGHISYQQMHVSLLKFQFVFFNARHFTSFWCGQIRLHIFLRHNDLILLSNKNIFDMPNIYPYTSILRRQIVRLLLRIKLKLTCHHINRRHFCFNIKSISVHPLLWINVMLDFICMVFVGMWTTFR